MDVLLIRVPLRTQKLAYRKRKKRQRRIGKGILKRGDDQEVDDSGFREGRRHRHRHQKKAERPKKQVPKRPTERDLPGLTGNKPQGGKEEVRRLQLNYLRKDWREIEKFEKLFGGQRRGRYKRGEPKQMWGVIDLGAKGCMTSVGG